MGNPNAASARTYHATSHDTSPTDSSEEPIKKAYLFVRRAVNPLHWRPSLTTGPFGVTSAPRCSTASKAPQDYVSSVAHHISRGRLLALEHGQPWS